MRLFALLTASALLGACTASPKQQSQANLANPASVYCTKVSGRVEIRKDANGAETGYCHLPSGEAIEEWALFRRDHPAQ